MRTTRARGSILAAALLAGWAALVLAGCASSHRSASGHTAGDHPAAGRPSSTGTAPTVSKSFHAYGADGELAVPVGDVASGNCWTSSIAAPASGAYRCFAGNKILDPCFAPPGRAPAQVACVEAPWADALVLQLTDPLPAADGAGPHRPWAFELDNGARCVASTGTVPAVRGVNLGYHCTDGHDAGLLDTRAPRATADYGDPTGQTLRSVTVTTIWRG